MNLVEEVAITEMGAGGASIYESTGEGEGRERCPHCGSPALPSAIQSESGSRIPLRCFVRKAAPDIYIAECIDLDLGVEAKTEDAAIAGLRDQIVGYLLVVLDGVETDQEAPAAVLRPAPLSHRIRYYFEYMKYLTGSLFLGSRPHSTKRFYEAPYGFGGSDCPAHYVAAAIHVKANA